jgi:hypothetical protein
MLGITLADGEVSCGLFETASSSRQVLIDSSLHSWHEIVCVSGTTNVRYEQVLNNGHIDLAPCVPVYIFDCPLISNRAYPDGIAHDLFLE